MARAPCVKYVFFFLFVQHQGARTRRNVLVAVGTLCVVAAAVAVSTLHTYQRQNVLFQMPTETQALAELSKSDMMLASSAPKAAPQLQSAAVLKKAAEMLEKNQEARIKKAAAKLQQEETQEGEVKTAAAKLLAEARHEEQKQNSAKIVAQQKAAVEAQFIEGKERILAEAAAAISKAEAKKNKMENAMGQKVRLCGWERVGGVCRLVYRSMYPVEVDTSVLKIFVLLQVLLQVVRGAGTCTQQRQMKESEPKVSWAIFRRRPSSRSL